MFSKAKRSNPTSGENRITLASPLSTTMRMPSRVSDVSATLVDKMILRLVPGSIALAWSSSVIPPNSCMTSQSRPSRVCERASNVRWISPIPGKNASTSPSFISATSRIASTMRSERLSSGLVGRYRMATGKFGDSTRTMGAPSNCDWIKWESIVADMMTIFKSSRNACCTRLNIPSSKSESSDLS